MKITSGGMLSPDTMTLTQAKAHLAFWFDQIDTINNPVDRRAVELVGQWLDGRVTDMSRGGCDAAPGE